MLPNSTKCRLNYLGPSMNPTFKTPDYLQIIPYNGKKIRAGDVVVFSPPGESRKIVHRVVAAGSAGIRTRGDNNTDMDPWVLRPENILGRVAGVQKGERWRRVWGGPWGQVFVLVVRIYDKIDAAISLLLHPLYHWLAKTGALKHLLKGSFKARILSFNRRGGKEFQLILGSRVVGQRLPGTNSWQIKRPFRLLVDESTLSENLEE